jgi:uncharacterized damage-inducible protein DinB
MNDHERKHAKTLCDDGSDKPDSTKIKILKDKPEEQTLERSTLQFDLAEENCKEMLKMNTKTQVLLAMWIESRTRFANQIPSISEEDLKKKLLPSQNSVGFLIRHIGEVELLFAKNVFGDSTIKVYAKTVIEKRDTGEWTNLEALKGYVNESFEKLKSIIERQTNEDWEIQITTTEFGTKTKAEAFGRIVSHTAYHAGQMAIINKYGNP